MMIVGCRAWLISSLLLASIPCFGQHMNAKDAPCQVPSTTTDEYGCFSAAYKKSDAELNKLYRRVQAVLGDSELAKLKEAQRLWIQFRDTNCSAEYELYRGGSAAPMVRVACLEAVTRHRTEELQAMYGWRLEKWSNDANDEGTTVGSIPHPTCFVGDQAVTDPTTKSALRVFWNDLEAAIQHDNRQEIAKMMAYPLLVSSSSGRFRVHSAQEFVGKYDQIFTKKLKSFLLKQEPDCIARIGAKGFSVGNGEVWFDEFPDSKIRIFTVNIPDEVRYP